jgi:xanthine dehydrogenase accessory factor
VRIHALRALETGEPIVLRLVPGGESSAGEVEQSEGVVVEHNPCLSGGTLEIFLDPQLPAPRWVVAGGAPVARALEELARAAGYDVVRADPAEVDPQPTDAAVVVASHGFDEERVLVAALERGVPYVALVSSEKRGDSVRDSLEIAPDLRARLHAPAGLPLGARSPADIAIAILAQFVQESRAQPAVLATIPVRTEVAVDPICGMEVAVSEASLRLELGGETYYFCREGCRAAFAEQHRADVVKR